MERSDSEVPDALLIKEKRKRGNDNDKDGGT